MYLLLQRKNIYIYIFSTFVARHYHIIRVCGYYKYAFSLVLTVTDVCLTVCQSCLQQLLLVVLAGVL